MLVFRSEFSLTGSASVFLRWPPCLVCALLPSSSFSPLSSSLSLSSLSLLFSLSPLFLSLFLSPPPPSLSVCLCLPLGLSLFLSPAFCIDYEPGRVSWTLGRRTLSRQSYSGWSWHALYWLHWCCLCQLVSLRKSNDMHSSPLNL